jgi:hypothetical protein
VNLIGDGLLVCAKDNLILLGEGAWRCKADECEQHCGEHYKEFYLYLVNRGLAFHRLQA